MTSALTRLRTLRELDTDVRGGRSLAHVFDSGLLEVHRIAAEAVAMYADTNGLDPAAFPSLLTMENELVGFGCDLVDAPATAVGTVTSGGTESIMLAVQGARDSRPEVAHPNLVLPETAHPSFLRAAHYFGVTPIVTRVDGHYRAQVGAMAEAMDRSTVLAVASAPSYAHGVVDPIAWIAAAAAANRIPLHVDACIGGWILAYADRVGRMKPAWTFAVPGVSSISIDLHKYAYAPKGASLLLHRAAADRRPTYFTLGEWPGNPMVSTTMQSTKSGGPLAGAWATVQTIGEDGYLGLARDCFEAVDRLVAGIKEVPGLELVVHPDSTLVVVRTDGSCDVFTVADEMLERGWHLQPQLSWHGEPPTLHLTVSAATLALVEECLAALRDSVAAARAAGPTRVERTILNRLNLLRPGDLTDEVFDDLMAAAGLAGQDGGVSVPGRTARFNVLVNAAPVAVREDLMATHVDRLFRPVRA
ncbi:aminotransferase class V-fold PLP-dependent enzyme [Nocardioides sp.]|uniref:pyridoxal phosphate-dependent decarboxylase family protein n=1 Tax=Nocardioides sp. TaxID=35761 RepID=UPI0031FF146A|nr:Pyridoxal-dependent decarboxylase [Nocardioides sp.]